MRMGIRACAVVLTVPVGAAVEDCHFALGIVRRAAAFAGTDIETEAGKLTVGEIDNVFQDSASLG